MTPQLVAGLIAQPVRWQVHGSIAAPVAVVAELLLAVRAGRVGYDNALVLADRPAALTGRLSIVPGAAPGTFQTVGGSEHIEVAVEPAIPALAVQGRFGNVYTVEPAGSTSRLLHRIHAAPPDPPVTDLEQQMRTALAQVIRVLADTLDVDGAVAPARARHERVPGQLEHLQRKEADMSIVRVHTYTVDPADLEELIARRTDLISAIRAAHPGLAETRLTQYEDGTFTDAWRWDSPEQMRAAFPATQTLPEVAAAMAKVSDATARNGQIIDEQ